MAKVSSSRIVIGFALAFLVLGVNFLGMVPWAILVLVTTLLGYQEFLSLCANKEIYPSKQAGKVSLVLFMLAPLLLPDQHNPLAIFVVQAAILGLSSFMAILRLLMRGKTNFEDISATIFGIVYLGLLPSYLVWIRDLNQGALFIAIFIFTVGLNDVAALFIGRYFGKTPLSPQISPNKTIEGSLAGLIAGASTFYFIVKAFDLKMNYEVLHLGLQPGLADQLIPLLIGFLIALVGQIGDLVESLFKRGVGVKDSGSIFQSHGGVLDRTDSQFATAWLAYFIFAYLLS